MQQHSHSTSHPPLAQCASDVMMVRPAAFAFDPEAARTNAFQVEPVDDRVTIHRRALAEFDQVVRNLSEAGLRVIVFDDLPQPETPDALFPNNWMSTHGDGTVVLYPMCVPVRRLERREDIIRSLSSEYGFGVRRVIDLRPNEDAGRFLEGTGSVVFDHRTRSAYASISERTHEGMLYEIQEVLDFEVQVFHATDRSGMAVYHTNVVMSIGSVFAIVCVDAIDDVDERSQVVGRLEATGHEVIRLTRDQMASFAANALELQSLDGEPVLAISQRGWQSLAPAQQARLASLAQIVPTSIPTIESVGGGSIRCMIAEIFLPKLADSAGIRSAIPPIDFGISEM